MIIAIAMSRTALRGPGLRIFRGGVAMIVTHWSGMLSTGESAVFLGVRETTIRQWRFKGHLRPQGLDERNRPLHTVQALRDAEALVTRHGIEASGVNPRTLRGRPALARRPRSAAPAISPGAPA